MSDSPFTRLVARASRRGFSWTSTYTMFGKSRNPRVLQVHEVEHGYLAPKARGEHKLRMDDFCSTSVGSSQDMVFKRGWAFFEALLRIFHVLLNHAIDVVSFLYQSQQNKALHQPFKRFHETVAFEPISFLRATSLSTVIE
ncbi:hypothetical protein HPP92_009610 [Vanilla planifolia]|uniref:Uncharacterized protein n=1 Tax=Vanilla planifolia TaxID=51239 RepID=A0A835V748_VANPL|nr:hypothetical protein HPP92_009610 [Vanilla planifolia]